jgi:hypothetical protein
MEVAEGGNILINSQLQIRPARSVWVILAVALALAAPASWADVDLAVLPASISVEPGQIFDVELTIIQAGAAFNAYDAVVGFDPDVLTFIQRPAAEQEGPLMTEVCGNTFHSFQVGPFDDTLNISHVLLCAGASVTGPGVVYRLRFQASDLNTTTDISLLQGTAFYLAGIFVTPVFTYDSEVQIGAISPVPDIPGTLSPNLSAAPNPFNPSTRIFFDVAEEATARITVYSSRGSRVAVLFDGQASAGPNSVVWDGRDTQGLNVGSGVYLVRLELGGESYLRRVTLLK